MAPVDEVGQRKGRSSMIYANVSRGPGGADCRNPGGADFIDYELRITNYGLRITDWMAPVDEVGQRKGRSSMNHTGVPRGPGGAYCQ